MKLYMFEHCSLCFRVRMTAALKQEHLQEVVIVRVLPILRSLAVVKGLRFPKRVHDYFESMMALVGYKALRTA
jgi:glutaredoxin 2